MQCSLWPVVCGTVDGRMGIWAHAVGNARVVAVAVGPCRLPASLPYLCGRRWCASANAPVTECSPDSTAREGGRSGPPCRDASPPTTALLILCFAGGHALLACFFSLVVPLILTAPLSRGTIARICVQMYSVGADACTAQHAASMAMNAGRSEGGMTWAK